MTGSPVPATPLDEAAVGAGCTIDLAGVPVRIEAEDRRRAGAVVSLLGHARVVTDAPAGRLAVRAAPVAVPPTPGTPLGTHAEVWHGDAARLWIRTRDGVTVACTRDDVVVGGEAATLRRAFRVASVPALAHLLARHDRHLLHAGAIVVDDRALLVAGDTGSGKSTFAFAAHRLGWPVLADDLVALRATDSGVRVHGLPRPIAVPRDVAGGELDGATVLTEDPRQRSELPLGTLTHGEVAVGATLVLEGPSSSVRGPGDPRLRVRPGAAALRTLLRAAPTVLDPDVRPSLLAVAAAVARAPAWSVTRGADAGTALEWATGVLHEVSERPGRAGPVGPRDP